MQSLPSTDYAAPSFPQYSGMLVALVPSSQPGFGVELQRTSDVGGGVAASSAAASIAQLDPVVVIGHPYFDQLPVDGQKRFYRARHIADGYTAGAYTSWTPGFLPIQLSEKDVRNAVAPVAGRGSGESGTISKTLILPYSAFTIKVTSAAADPAFSTGYLAAASSGPLILRAPVVIPVDAQLTSGSSGATMTMTYFTSSSASGTANLDVTLWRIPSSAPSTGRVQIDECKPSNNSVFNTWKESTWSNGSAETIDPLSSYELELQFTGSSDFSNLRLSRVSIPYTMPTYDITR